MTILSAPTESLPARSRQSPAGDLPELTMRQLTYRVERLCRLFRLGEQDRGDLESEAACEVLRALLRHNAALASRTTYAKGVLDLWYGQKCKQLRRDAGRAARRVPLPERGAEGREYRDRRAPSPEAADLRIDLAERLSRLPGDLGALAHELQSKSIPQIAAERGVHRGTVHRLVLRLRSHLAALDPAAS